MASFVTCFFNFTSCLQVSPMSQRVLALYSFLCQNNIPLYRCTTFCLFIHQMDLWIVPTSGSYESCFCQYRSVQVFVWTQIFIPLGFIPRSRISGSNGILIFKFVMNCRSLSQNGAPLYIPTSSLEGSAFSSPLPIAI